MAIPSVPSLLLLLPLSTGVVVESVARGTPADEAGLRPGDVLVSWRPASTDSGAAGFQGRELLSPLDLEYAAVEAAPRTAVVLSGQRDGRALEVRIAGGEWQLRSRPAAASAPPTRDAVEAAAAVGDWPLACWMALRAAEQPGPEFDLDEALAVAEDTCDSDARGERGAFARHALARAWQAQKRYPEAEAAWREALTRWEALAPHGLGAAAAWQGLGSVFWERGLPNEAEPPFRRALALREELAPGGLEVAATLHSLGLVTYWQSDHASAAKLLRRALELRQRLAPRSLLVAESMLILGAVVAHLGDAEEARRLGRDALASASSIEPEGPIVANIELEMGNAAWLRVDIPSAEGHYRRALAIAEKIEPEGRLAVRSLGNLANIARARGDVEGAITLFKRTVAIVRLHWPDSLHTAGFVATYGDSLAEVGRFSEAEAAYDEAIAVGERAAPRSATFAFILATATDMSRARGDVARFERYLKRLLEVQSSFPKGALDGPILGFRADLELAHGRLDEAERWIREEIASSIRFNRADYSLANGYRRLAQLEQRRGRVPEAAEAYRRAVDALEGLRVQLGGTGSGRLGFGVRYSQLYHEAIEALMEAGRPAEAFHCLERSRARALLEMMAERALTLDTELPPDLRRRRRALGVEYERAQRALLEAQDEKQQIEAAARLETLERQQEQAADETRRASSRIAEVTYPQPLEVERARQALGSESAFLGYSVGPQRTVLFVLAPQRAGENPEHVAAFMIPLGAEALRTRITAWRRMAEMSAPPPAFFSEARALYDLLLRPAEPSLSRASRLVISPDGPLHQLPFAALRRRGGYLAQWKPLSLVPSASVLDQIVHSRPAAARAPSLVAFGDPRAPGLPDLAGSRREVAAIRGLFTHSQVFLGSDATKPRMEAVANGYRYVHFAGHGVLDEHLPLESALALSPAPGAETPDDGRLHAWEIFERLRLDADLVTLSACRSAAGKELAGEGVLGLTRAFHYAGARSVVAALWRVPDRSTPEFMRRFYGSLKLGLPKDEALRRAQIEAILAGHHPLRWASFQLYGDWR